MSAESKSPLLRVLLVDDNVTNRLVAGKMIAKNGAEVLSVESGEAAVKASSESQFDLIFMDCMMPDMDGYEATGHIRDLSSDSKNRDTPIVALTANAMEGDREKCLNAGMSDYLAKPIHPKDLAEVFERWASRGPAMEVDSAPRGQGGSEAALVDLSSLVEVFGDSKEELRPLVEAFVESLREELMALQRNEGPDFDLETLRLRCHTIKGASANYGAKPLSRVAMQVELACTEGREAEARVSVPQLKELMERTIEAANQAVS
ncbi:response regulator [Pelagicoccus enzymogenes]|uniref:response regulator n=1 Tax=Pelagicoccus enzymogenes TaxID=2773457 RepID=UPI00280CD493|nr:response regulator [Pelagicoccus enzymogenes]MDQ8197294.1 response regulator [Pelagicoccus enzymogenes]